MDHHHNDVSDNYCHFHHTHLLNMALEVVAGLLCDNA